MKRKKKKELKRLVLKQIVKATPEWKRLQSLYSQLLEAKDFREYRSLATQIHLDFSILLGRGFTPAEISDALTEVQQ